MPHKGISKLLWQLVFAVAALTSISTTFAQKTETKPESATAGKGVLEEVFVTANKRSQNLMSLAGAVTALDRQQLDEAGASNFEDYLSLSPGVQFNSSIPGISHISMRGVTTSTLPNQAQTAVGVYYADIPLTDPSTPISVPDIDAFDAARIEILRGPQGALYGSASLGGAINYIPEEADPERFAMAASFTASKATNSDISRNSKLMLNLPIVKDTLALRAVGYRVDMPGFIDNIGTGVDASNKTLTEGGRLMLTWLPTDTSSLQLQSLSQKTDVDDIGYVNKDLGDLKKETHFTEPTSNTFQLHALRYEYDADYGSWALILSSQEKSSTLEYDGGAVLGVPTNAEQILLQQGGDVEGYSAELRFISPPSERFEYLAGISYAYRDASFDVVLDSASLTQLSAGLPPISLPLLPPINSATAVLRQNVAIEAPEKALFFEGTWRFLDTFELTAGGRYYDNELLTKLYGRGLILAPSGSTEFRDSRASGDKGFNPKVSLSWSPNNDLMIYGLYSRGYRLGGPNLVPNTPLTNTRPHYDPDEVKNYELGIKAELFDSRLSATLAMFYIDWSDIPLVVVDNIGLFTFLDNAGDAQIRGAELSIAALPFNFLNLHSSITYVDAELLDYYDPMNGRPPVEEGDTLPGSPHWVVSNTVTASWPDIALQPTLTLIHRFESDSSTNLSFQDIRKGDYNLFDLRAGISIGDFSITAFGKNLTDKRGVTAANNYAQNGGDVVSLQFITPPRDIGIEFKYQFAP